MAVHDFAFIIDADPHDEAVEEVFLDEPFDDSSLILQNGALALSFDREAESFKDAVLSAYADIRDHGFSILSFDPDYLVDAAEIARRVDITRSVVSKYGHCEPDFPAPVRRVSTKRPVYDWVKVSRWFVQREQLDVSEYHKALVSRVMNFGAQATSTMQVPLDIPQLVKSTLERA